MSKSTLASLLAAVAAVAVLRCRTVTVCSNRCIEPRQGMSHPCSWPSQTFRADIQVSSVIRHTGLGSGRATSYMVRTPRWGQVSDHSRDPERWNEFDVEDTAEKLEVKDQLLEDGAFTVVPQLRVLSSGNTWRRWGNVQALPAGDLKVKVICYVSGWAINLQAACPDEQANKYSAYLQSKAGKQQLESASGLSSPSGTSLMGLPQYGRQLYARPSYL